MTRWRRTAAVASVSLAALVILLAPLPSPARDPVRRTIRVEASQYAFEPATVRVQRGDSVTIELVSTDVVHGLYVDGYGVSVTADPGQTARLSFVADRAGTFRLRCSITCGPLHPFMIGKLKVGSDPLLWRVLGLALVGILAGSVVRWT